MNRYALLIRDLALVAVIGITVGLSLVRLITGEWHWDIIGPALFGSTIVALAKAAWQLLRNPKSPSLSSDT